LVKYDGFGNVSICWLPWSWSMYTCLVSYKHNSTRT